MSSKWRHAKDLLGPLGLLVIVGSRWAVRAGNALPGGEEPYLIAAAVLIFAHILLRWDTLLGLVGRRQMKYGTNTVVLSLVVLGILGTVNYLVARNNKRWDLTGNQRFSLAPQTKKVLAALEEDATITYFQREAESSLAARDRLKEYQGASSRVKVAYVDPWKSPAKARQYDITTLPSLVVEYRGKRERISNDSEQDITNAFIKVTRDGAKTVCFVEGEGERDPDESGDQGFSAARAALERSQYETRKVLLLREKAVPSDCAVLVVAGPEKDLLGPAIDALREFVAAGGKLLVLIEPGFDGPLPNLETLLGEWNVETGGDVVVDVSGMGQLFGTGDFTPLVADYPYHEITKDLRTMTAFHMARSVEAGTAPPSGVSVQNLMQTSEASWAESDLSLGERVEMDEGLDRTGPISLGVAVTIEVPSAETELDPPGAEAADTDADTDTEPELADDEAAAEEGAPETEGRVVVLGDADFASNALLGFQGNQDFFLNTVAWLSQDKDLISIRPREAEDQRMMLTQQQQGDIFWVAIVYLPGLFIVLGVATWWRRRG